MRVTRFSIPEAMLPYFMCALAGAVEEVKGIKAIRTAKGYDIEYEASREDDNRVRTLMTKIWKDRNLPPLEY